MLFRTFFFLIFLFSLRAEWESFFPGDDDPCIHRNVNVITGQLNLSFIDTIVQGPVPYPIVRTYSSSGAFEKDPGNQDRILFALQKGVAIQGGWSFLPHLHLLIERDHSKKTCKATLSETSGTIAYSYSHQIKENVYMLSPTKGPVLTTTLSARNNPLNYHLKLEVKKGRAVLYLPTGGSRVYEGPPVRKATNFPAHYKLKQERLPSGHVIDYSYDKHEALNKIALKNKQRTKTYSWIDVKFSRNKGPFPIHLDTSDTQQLHYSGMEFQDRFYIKESEGSCKPQETYYYDPARKGLGARINGLSVAGQLQFSIKYIKPENKEEEKKWFEKPYKKHFSADKIEEVLEPSSPNAELITVAHFKYQKTATDIRDPFHCLTRYHHDGKKITAIDYFTKEEQLYSTQKFYWEGTQLIGKAMLNPEGKALFAKTFSCDPFGNIQEETLFGNLTGEKEDPFLATPDGALQDADSYYKRYKYLANIHLPVLEEEENGPTIHYHYKPGTDLLESKFTCENEKILKRDFLFYDEDHFLIQEITDDGSSKDSNDLANVTERHIKRYSYNQEGFLITSATYYLEETQEKHLKTSRYTYSSDHKIETETVYDQTQEPRFTLHTQYNSLGKITKQTDPLGQESSYAYDALGKPTFAQEPGLAPLIHHYDPAGFKISEQMHERKKLFTYDKKGQLHTQTDDLGNTTEHVYDSFGRRTKIILPPLSDEENSRYTPEINYAYNEQSYVTSETNPRGESTQILYTTLGKPYRIHHPDGTQTKHIYNKNGTLAKTHLPDGTLITYHYDIFQRMTSKKIFSEGTLLSQEEWTYNLFHLLTYTSSTNLTTTYLYDKAGRLIAEEAEGRRKNYTYDSLGFLERKSDGVTTHVQIHDFAGHVTEEWLEDNTGKRENHILYTYQNNKKIKAERKTSQGISLDQFIYDEEGRLQTHIDPENNAYHIHYTIQENPHGQNIWIRKNIDPLGNSTEETHDPSGRIIQIEKQNPQGQTVAKQQNLYDKAGNKAKALHTVYENTTPVRNITHQWVHNSMGQVLQEIEEQKITTYCYFPEQRTHQKILPDGNTLTYHFDPLGRPIETQSSDHTHHLKYHYSPDHTKIQIHDLIHNISLERTHNAFGELIEENGKTWIYDPQGRCTTFTLPHIGTIHYHYQGMHLATVERLDSSGNYCYAHHYTHFDENGHVHEEQLPHNLGTITTHRDTLERPTLQITPWTQEKIHYGPSGLVQNVEHTLYPEKHYTYDPLNQLIQDTPFDSLGNPTHCNVNQYNQILKTPAETLDYDPNGNPSQRTQEAETIHYTYDALGRLTQITTQEKTTTYLYDPLSRLYSKQTTTPETTQTIYYLYDNEKEVGTLDTQRNLLEFKVLGLGIKGDIGAAIAIELKNETFIPLHDFRGNIIALFSQDGILVESSEFDPFGKEDDTPHQNPWRFSSKRTEETGLVFFGFRFYDPKLQRFLTPDPSGFAESPNLYIYTLNSPLNRLDLFGLDSENFLVPLRIEVSLDHFNSLPQIIPCKYILSHGKVDGCLSCGSFYELKFSPLELETGKIDILDHLKTLLPTSGNTIGLISLGNGINTSSKELHKMTNAISSQIEEGTLVFGIHNRSKGFLRDIFRVFLELWFNKETRIVKDMKHILTGLAERVAATNSDASLLHLMHSENGLIVHRAYETMPEKWQKIVQKQTLFGGYGLVLPIPEGFGKKAINIYSEKDGLTLGFKKHWDSNALYDIRIIQSVSKWHEKSAFYYDHAFLAPTGQVAIEGLIKEMRDIYGFHKPCCR